MFVPTDASGVEVLAKMLDRYAIERVGVKSRSIVTPASHSIMTPFVCNCSAGHGGTRARSEASWA